MSTKTITATKLRSNMAAAFDSISTDDVLIVTRRGHKERAIIDLDKFEDLLAASDPEFLKSIKKARAEYQSGDTFSLDEAFGNI